MTKITNIILAALLIIITVALTCACTQTNAPKDEIYATTTVVVEINEQDDLVACEDCNGNVWTFYGVEDWQEGDFATLTMDTCGTADIYDDEIVVARYSGNVEGLK